MTKRYILPEWNSLNPEVSNMLNDHAPSGMSWPDVRGFYNFIREATAVEDGAPPATRIPLWFAKSVLRQVPAEAVDLLKSDDTVTLEFSATAFSDLWHLVREVVARAEEAERLVGKARGEDKPLNAGWKDVFGPKPGASWADVGGGEEKPVRAAQQPATDRPRCGTCRFGHVVKNPINDGVMCQRFPQHRFIDSDNAPVHWCGEWRAKT